VSTAAEKWQAWRETAPTLAVEKLGFRDETVEMQLSHEVRDTHGRAYN